MSDISVEASSPEIQRHEFDGSDTCPLQLSPILGRRPSLAGFTLTPRLNSGTGTRKSVDSGKEDVEPESSHVKQKTPNVCSKYFIPKRPMKEHRPIVRHSEKSCKKLPLESLQDSCLPSASHCQQENQKSPYEDTTSAAQAGITQGHSCSREKTTSGALQSKNLEDTESVDICQNDECKKYEEEDDGFPPSLSDLTPSVHSSYDDGTNTQPIVTLGKVSSVENLSQGMRSRLWSSMSGISPLSASSGENKPSRTGVPKITATQTSAKAVRSTMDDSTVFTSTPINLKADLDWEELSSLTDGASDSSLLFARRESRFVCSSDIQFSDFSQDSATDGNIYLLKRKQSLLSKWGLQEQLSGSDKENVDPSFDLCKRSQSRSPLSENGASFTHFPATQPILPKKKRAVEIRTSSLSQPLPISTYNLLHPSKRIRVGPGLDNEDAEEEMVDASSTESKSRRSSLDGDCVSCEDVVLRRASTIEEGFFGRCVSGETLQSDRFGGNTPGSGSLDVVRGLACAKEPVGCAVGD